MGYGWASTRGHCERDRPKRPAGSGKTVSSVSALASGTQQHLHAAFVVFGQLLKHLQQRFAA